MLRGTGSAWTPTPRGVESIDIGAAAASGGENNAGENLWARCAGRDAPDDFFVSSDDGSWSCPFNVTDDGEPGPALALFRLFAHSALRFRVRPGQPLMMDDVRERMSAAAGAADADADAVVGSGSVRDPRVRVMNTSTVSSRHSCAMPRRFSSMICALVSPSRHRLESQTTHLVRKTHDLRQQLAVLELEPPLPLLELRHRALVRLLLRPSLSHTVSTHTTGDLHTQDSRSPPAAPDPPPAASASPSRSPCAPPRTARRASCSSRAPSAGS